PKSDIINLLEIFDIQLARIGTEIIISRIEFVDKMSKISRRIHNKLTLGKEDLNLNYNSTVKFYNENKNNIEKNFLEQLKKYIDKDLIRGFTSVGPHRDDIQIE